MKRIVDVIAALLLIIILLPVMFICACLIALKLGRPVLFIQVRPGLHGKPFRLIKFRSMSQAVDIMAIFNLTLNV